MYAQRQPIDPNLVRVAIFYSEVALRAGEKPRKADLPRVRAAIARYLGRPSELTQGLPGTLCWLLLQEIEAALTEGRDPAAIPPKSRSDLLKYNGLGPWVIRHSIAPLGLVAHGPPVEVIRDEFADLSALARDSLMRRGFRQKNQVACAVLCELKMRLPGIKRRVMAEILAWLALPPLAADLVREAASLRERLVEYQQQNGQEPTKVLGQAMAPLATKINLARKGLPVSPGAGAQIGGGWLSSW